MKILSQRFSAFLCIVYFATNCLFAHSPEINFWSERRVPRTPSVETLPSVSTLPLTYGSMRPAGARPARPTSPTVVHFQDVHQNLEAQQNLGKALDEMMRGQRLDLIAVEGAWGPIDLRAFRSFPNRNVIRIVSDYLLKTNEISGPIHAALTTSGPVPPIVGVDDERAYNANVEAYRRSAPRAAGLKSRLAELKRRSQEDRRRFNPALLAFDRHVQLYRESKIPLGDYLEILTAQLPSNDIPVAVKQFQETLRLEKSLDFDAVTRERERLLRALMSRSTKAEMDEFAKITFAYRNNAITHSDFYRRLKTACALKGISLQDSPLLEGHLRYVSLSDELDSNAFFEDVRRLEQKGYERRIRAAFERTALARSRLLSLTEKLLGFALTRTEWREYRGLKTDALALDVSTFEEFYEQAEVRDRAMASNLLKAIKQTNATRVVLVTGGFHSSGLNALLNRHGVGTIAYVPRITAVDTAEGSAYLTAFMQEKTPLERIFVGAKLFLARNPVHGAFKIPIIASTFYVDAARSYERVFNQLAPGAVDANIQVRQTDIAGRVQEFGVVVQNAGLEPAPFTVRRTDKQILDTSEGSEFLNSPASWPTRFYRQISNSRPSLLLAFSGIALVIVPVVLTAALIALVVRKTRSASGSPIVAPPGRINIMDALVDDKKQIVVAQLAAAFRTAEPDLKPKEALQEAAALYGRMRSQLQNDKRGLTSKWFESYVLSAISRGHLSRFLDQFDFSGIESVTEEGQADIRRVIAVIDELMQENDVPADSLAVKGDFPPRARGPELDFIYNFFLIHSTESEFTGFLPAFRDALVDALEGGADSAVLWTELGGDFLGSISRRSMGHFMETPANVRFIMKAYDVNDENARRFLAYQRIWKQKLDAGRVNLGLLEDQFLPMLEIYAKRCRAGVGRIITQSGFLDKHNEFVRRTGLRLEHEQYNAHILRRHIERDVAYQQIRHYFKSGAFSKMLESADEYQKKERAWMIERAAAARAQVKKMKEAAHRVAILNIKGLAHLFESPEFNATERGYRILSYYLAGSDVMSPDVELLQRTASGTPPLKEATQLYLARIAPHYFLTSLIYDRFETRDIPALLCRRIVEGRRLSDGVPVPGKGLRFSDLEELSTFVSVNREPDDDDIAIGKLILAWMNEHGRSLDEYEQLMSGTWDMSQVQRARIHRDPPHKIDDQIKASRDSWNASMMNPATTDAARAAGLDPESLRARVGFAPDFEFLQTLRLILFLKDHPGTWWQHGFRILGAVGIWALMLAAPHGFGWAAGWVAPVGFVRPLVEAAGYVSLGFAWGLAAQDRHQQLSRRQKVLLFMVYLPNVAGHTLYNLFFWRAPLTTGDADDEKPLTIASSEKARSVDPKLLLRIRAAIQKAISQTANHELYKRYSSVEQKMNIEMFGVLVMDSSESSVQQFLKQHGIVVRNPVLVDFVRAIQRITAVKKNVLKEKPLSAEKKLLGFFLGGLTLLGALEDTSASPLPRGWRVPAVASRNVESIAGIRPNEKIPKATGNGVRTGRKSFSLNEWSLRLRSA